ncbi:MAG: aldehyde ferredoxin oxidoreductase family protein [Anaerolineales bacterium]
MQPILRVDLSSRKIDQFKVPTDWEVEYLGGASLAARILYDYLTPDLDPLSPQAPLLFLNGPLSGTAGPAVGRYVVCGLSPATNLWGESNCGGFWGVELRKTGFDGLFITGRSNQPVYLFCDEEQVHIRPADYLWGMETYQTRDKLIEEIGISGTRVACIGPAGESLIPFALILSDHGRVAGRTGMGAIMGSKNLKAIAVKGNRSIPVYDPKKYNVLRSTVNRELREDPISQVARDLGTASVGDYFDYLMVLPKRYYTRGKSKGELMISGVNIKNTINVGISACHACVIACGRIADLGDGKKRKGAEFETLAGFGPNLLISDPVRITKLGEMCDRYGVDSISMSNVIGLAMLLFDQGVIGSEDTDGIEIKWGDADIVEDLLHKTIYKKGFGKYLSLGALKFARRFNAEDKAVQVNGLEAAYHDPRGASGMGLVYATSPRGACHNQSDYYLVEVGQVYSSLGLTYHSPRGGIEKVMNVCLHQDWRTLFNSLVMCFFANVPPDDIAALINSAVGLNLSVEDLIMIGERGWNLKRVINNRLGLRSANDKIPDSFLRPFEDDESEFVPEFPEMIKEYYRLRGWDAMSGFPGKNKLTELNLAWVMEDLEVLAHKSE